MRSERIARAVQRLWIGRCTIYVRQRIENPATGITDFQEQLVLENEPCRISFAAAPATGMQSDAATEEQTVKLFISPSASIPAGSHVRVTQHDQTRDYEASGVPALYSFHQEITLKLWKGWA